MQTLIQSHRETTKPRRRDKDRDRDRERETETARQRDIETERQRDKEPKRQRVDFIGEFGMTARLECKKDVDFLFRHTCS